MLKFTSVDKGGHESYPESVEVNDAGYILLTEDPDAVSYNVYAPLKGFEAHGPWYFKRAYKRNEARRARFTVVGLYEQSELLPLLCRTDLPERLLIPLPTPMPDQEFWCIYGGPPRYTPFAIVKCP